MIRVVCVLAVVAGVASAGPINGNVFNKTFDKPASGAEVVASRVTEGLPEVSRTKTDANGKFTLQIPDTEARQPHLIRVEYQGANYPKFTPPGTQNISIDVYEAAKQVEGITGTADILAFQTTQDNSVEVIETYVVRNDSNPPRTQLSERSFEIFLPKDAKIENAAAGRAGGMPVNTAPVPEAEPGKYAFIYPLRPGETLFRVTYQLPYSGHLTFRPKLTVPMENVAVMLPEGMKLEPRSSGFSAAPDENGMHVALLKAVQPTDHVEFQLSGKGTIPERTAEKPETNSNAPGGGLGTPIQASGPLDKYKWWILGALGLAMIAGAGYVAGRPVAGRDTREQLLTALKEELFRLEADRAQGKLTDSEYNEAKTAMEVIIRRSIAKKADTSARTVS